MPKPKPRSETAAMLLERDIALWDANHYNMMTGRPTKKDPVSVTLVTPRALDRMFTGRGPDVDAAIMNALASNSGLNYHEPGVTGALARLENELHLLNTVMWKQNSELLGDDYDVPF